MRLMMVPIEVIAKFTFKGPPKPVKFRLEQEHILTEIKVDRIVSQEEEKLVGNRMVVYLCQSRVNGTESLYELKYEVATFKWFLAKM